MTLQDTITIPDTLFAQVVDDEMVILDTVTQEYFGLDASGAMIWEYLSESGSLQSAFDAMFAAYDVDAKQLENDICRFVQELVDAGLVQQET